MGYSSRLPSTLSRCEINMPQNREMTVFANGRHNLLDMSGAAPNELARLERFVPGLFDLMASWLVERVRR